MRTYKEAVKDYMSKLENGTFSFNEYEHLDYTGVGFGYNLKNNYPKTLSEAKEELKTPLFDEVLELAKNI